MINFKSKNKGETIIETLIAVSILTIGISITSTLMSGSLQNMNNAKNRVIAVNIAREGIEAVRNIRDTNWLKFSGKRRVCWNHLPQQISDESSIPPCSESCSDGDNDGVSDTYIEYKADKYIVYKAQGVGGSSSDCEAVQRWRLREIDTSDSFDESVLYYVDADPLTDSDGDGTLDNDRDMYNHLLDPTDHTADGNDAMGRSDNAAMTQFKRVISIDYIGNDGSFLGGDPMDRTYNRMLVTSKVTWMYRGAEQSVELKTHITDYFGRDNLES